MESVKSIIDRILVRHNELGERFNINQLRSIIRDKATPLEEFSLDDLEFNEQPYIRKILYKKDRLEVVLVKWKPNASSLIHDHGSSYGIVRVLQGSLGFELFNRDLEKAGEGLVPAIDTFDLPEGILHRMFNHEKDIASLSLHFYCPEINEMFVYDPVSMKQIKLEGGEDAVFNDRN